MVFRRIGLEACDTCRYLPGIDLAVGGRQGDHLVARGLYGSALMHRYMACVGGKHPFMGPEQPGYDYGVGLRYPHKKIHPRVGPHAPPSGNTRRVYAPAPLCNSHRCHSLCYAPYL